MVSLTVYSKDPFFLTTPLKSSTKNGQKRRLFREKGPRIFWNQFLNPHIKTVVWIYISTHWDMFSPKVRFSVMCVEFSKIGYQIRCFFWHVAPHGPVGEVECWSRTSNEYWPRLLLNESDVVKKRGMISLNFELLVISINQAISFIYINVVLDSNLKI